MRSFAATSASAGWPLSHGAASRGGPSSLHPGRQYRTSDHPHQPGYWGLVDLASKNGRGAAPHLFRRQREDTTPSLIELYRAGRGIGPDQWGVVASLADGCIDAEPQRDQLAAGRNRYSHDRPHGRDGIGRERGADR
jgi:hypothetical protein